MKPLDVTPSTIEAARNAGTHIENSRHWDTETALRVRDELLTIVAKQNRIISEYEKREQMESFTIFGATLTQNDLLDPGERVSRAAIDSGQMIEVQITLDGQARYLPLFTQTGVANIIKNMQEEGNRND